MTRPAIFYNTTASDPQPFTWFGSTGDPLWSGTGGGAFEQRLCQKPASLGTTPGRRGQFTQPTSYAMRWGRWAAHGNASVYTVYNLPWFNYYCQWNSTPFTELGFNPWSLYTIPSWVQDKLEIKALNKLRHSDVNFGVMLAEAGETAHLFETTAKRIADGVKLFRRTSPYEFYRAAKYQGTAGWKKTPQHWLELQYGWNPLMSDLDGAMQKLVSSQLMQKDIFAVKAAQKLEDTVEYDQVWSPGYATSTVSVSVQALAVVRLCYRLRNFQVALLSSLGLTNPAEIVWERVPYSFVVDWFLPVGNWLSALGGDFGYDFLNGSYSQFVRYKNLSTRSSPSPGGYRDASGPSISGEAVSFIRGIYTSSPVPGLYFKSPVSPTHIANASALLVEAFKRRITRR